MHGTGSSCSTKHSEKKRLQAEGLQRSCITEVRVGMQSSSKSTTHLPNRRYTLSGGNTSGSLGFLRSQMRTSPSLAPDASRFGVSSLNSNPVTWQNPADTIRAAGTEFYPSSSGGHSPPRCASRGARPWRPRLGPWSCSSEKQIRT
jgi:hypothetical protein